LGGSGLAGNDSKLFEIETKIAHQGEVNKARYNPGKSSVIATKTVSGEVHIFDYTKHPPKPENDVVKPDMKLLGHREEGFGLNWNPKKHNLIASGGNDYKVLVWNIEAGGSAVTPLLEMNHHKGPVEDVGWNRVATDILASVADDKQILL
jgi:histone-binding protein RBBP4